MKNKDIFIFGQDEIRAQLQLMRQRQALGDAYLQEHLFLLEDRLHRIEQILQTKELKEETT